jgi:cardiolipin synthase
MQVQETAVQTDRVLTVPNLLTFLRLALLPVLWWAAVIAEEDLLAGVLLLVGAVSDWADGVIARRTHTISRIGKLLDPIADRLTTLVVLIALGLRGLMPWWLIGLLLLRDVVLSVALLVLRRHGREPLEVRFVGKAATGCLLLGLPMLFFGTGTVIGADLARSIGWAWIGFGVLLYWWSAFVYLAEVRHELREPRPVAAPS